MNFSEFDSSTKTQWYNQAIKDLKGKDFDQALVWDTLEGFKVWPYYAEEDLKKLPLEAIQKAQNSKQTLGWQNRPMVKYSDEKSSNQHVLSLLNRGGEGVLLKIHSTAIDNINLTKVLDKIKLSEVPFYFSVRGNAKKTVESLKKFINYQMKGGIVDDFLADWMVIGELNENAWDNAAEVIKMTADSPQFRTLTVSSHHFHNAGANTTQELAFLLNSLVTYLDKLTEKGLTIEEIAPKIELSVSVGTNYFTEIAKIRALRYLYAKIIGEYKAENPQPLFIHAQTSTFYDSTLTANTNMLRATTEAMSAAIGGADAITIHAYDEVFRESDEFSERIARNISVLMKEEGHLNKSEDASAGSYFIENLTYQLIESAWKLFLEVESKGGIVEAFKDGFIQSEIEKSYQTKLAELQNGKIMVGVNKFQFGKEENLKGNQDNNDDRLLKNRRIAETFELNNHQ
ncbi:MAG: methylmalonyl-CoA mutase family protein [Spirosomaceae bacterium]|nr:methylmalonyl-CoA mutase family protein [Spirosomataceae bacterium]